MVTYAHMPARRIAPEIVNTEHNEVSVAYLDAAQKSLKLNNREFASALTQELGVAISENVLGYYLGVKSRRQPMPAAIMVAAARLSGLPLLDEQRERTLGERLERLETSGSRREALLQQLDQRIDQIENLVRQLLPPGGAGPRFVASPMLPEAE